MQQVASSKRLLGGVAGLTVGLLCGPLALGGSGEFAQPGGPAAFGLAAIVAGAVAGWILGPTALRAQGARQWIAVIAGMSILAVIVGAFTVAFTIAAQTSASDGSVLDWLGSFATGWLALGVLGVLVLGLPGLAITIVPAGIWAAVMAWLAGRRTRSA